ncbi:intersectin-2 isoform X3 [Trichogramma pretiosum]|uniref:intersectin-2 isoform X3 n=1 Tax=Trichogramma pretiosum TaxID=7493 RepID=UPI000C71A742|nr:intersectin-2 isoform X3 [Trichogramma pretiosum]
MTSPMTPGTDPWIILAHERARYQQQFDSLKPINGVITGGQAKNLFLQSQLPPAVLGQIWALSDTDSDGRMDINEFSIACKLINLRLRGFEVPSSLPPSLIRSLQAFAAVNTSVVSPVVAPQIPAQVATTNIAPIPRPTAGVMPSAVPGTIPAAVSANVSMTSPPLIPGPPSAVPAMTMPIEDSTDDKVDSGAIPQRPTPPDSIGAGFVPTAGPPPKPQPPSFPSSPVISPVKPVVPPMVPPPPAQMTQPLAAPVSNIDLFDLLMSEAMPPVAPVAPIAPMSTGPVPTTAFAMQPQAMQMQGMPAQVIPTQALPAQVIPTPQVVPATAGIIQPLPAAAPVVPIVGSGNGIMTTAVSPPAAVAPTITPPVTPLSTAGMNGSIIHTPVSTSTPISTTARPPSIDRMGSVDSQHSQHSITSPPPQPQQPLDWAVPHQTKLKYTQLFNTWDRTRSGFLSGPQARNIMVQTQLPQAILAQIWALSDMDSDGRLGCEEFVLAMHLCDMAKNNEVIPPALPLELIPPTFRRQRQSSVSSQGIPEAADPLAGMPQTTFEDKRKENFEKGQAELDRRRKSLLEIQRKEQEERERKEREEAEKREKIRLEQERRRQAELEQQMLRQKEIEEEKENERKRAQEQREAARKEMERQRQLEWENNKSQELQSQRQKEQEELLKLKGKNQSLTIDLGSLNDKVKELSQKICDTRVGVSTVKTTIDGMRTTRDQQLQEMASLKNKLREQNQRLLACGQEKARLEAKTKAMDAGNEEAQKLKQLAIKQLEDKIADLEKEVKEKEQEVENSNKQLEEMKDEMKELFENCVEMNKKFEEKKMVILDLRKSGAPSGGFSTAAWGEDAWGDTSTGEVDIDSWPTDDAANINVAATVTSAQPEEDLGGGKKYRALYEFVARNQDEISFQPGDIIIVPPVQNAEPGWMAGEIRGHTGWFPESYVEPVEVDVDPTEAVFAHQDSTEKRMLEGIAEVPENVSDAGSAASEAPYIEPITPKFGEGQLCNISATTLYQYRPTSEQHLIFNKGETVTVKEQQDVWCYGESSTGQVGWFPKAYVKMEEVSNGQDTASTEGLNEYYMSLYGYNSNEAGDLDFNNGEVILVIKKDGDWWTGVIGDRQGIFPSNYVEKYDMPVDQPAVATQDIPKLEHLSDTESPLKTQEVIKPQQQQQLPLEKTAEQLEEERAEAEDRAELPDFSAMSQQQYPSKRGRKPAVVQVIAPYKATSIEQLDLQKGQLIMVRKKTESGWWEGELQARGKKRQIGWFPASYVKVLQSSRPASNRSTPVSHRYQDSPTGDPFAEKVMALYPYKAQNDDELSFEKGDVIVVLSKDEDSWWRGDLNGTTGVFPSNYVSSMFEDVFNGNSSLTTNQLQPNNNHNYHHHHHYHQPQHNHQMDSMERKRQEYIKELIATEEAYIIDMQLVHEVFEKPLLASNVLSVADVEKIFINWRDIIACNDNFLRNLRIRKAYSEGGVVRMIGDILCESIPQMSAYVRFCSCQISSAVFLQRLTETVPAFVEVSQKCQQDPRTKGMPLSSFLIKPMQRITKYPLLIGKILEYTKADHPDRQYLQEALSKAEEFCTQVNEGVREKENSDRLEWLQTHVNCEGLEEKLVFNSLTNSLGPRKLLHYGILHKAKSGKELVGFLTNDFLMFAQPLKSLPSGHQFSFERCENLKFKLYRRPMFLQNLVIYNDRNDSIANGRGNVSPGTQGNAFFGTNGHDSPLSSWGNGEQALRTLKLGDGKKTITLVAQSVSECSLWVRRIAEARMQFAEKSRLLRQRSKQAQFKACGRILVTVLEGSSLKTINVRQTRPKGYFYVTIERAESLFYRVRGKCNAFCKVTMGSQEEHTIVVSGTDCPVWDTSMQFKVKNLHEDTLCITIFDKGYFSPDEFLGRAEVRVIDIVRDSKDACGPITKRIKLREVVRGDVVLKLDLRLFDG